MNWTAEQAFGGIRKTGKQPSFPVSKYGARRTIVNGITFASAKEGKRYQELLILEKCGAIKSLTLQPYFLLQERFMDWNQQWHRPIWYIADFQYFQGKDWMVEDCKGFPNALYKLKKKLFLFRYPSVRFIES